MISDAYAITDTNLILPKMADTDISIWYRCIPNDSCITVALTVRVCIVSACTIEFNSIW